MPRPSIHAAARSIEAEFAEPLRDVLAGFFAQRHTISSVAQVLEVSPSSVADYCRRHQLRPYSETIAMRRRPHTHPNVTSLAMQRASRRKIQWLGRSLSPAGWAAITGIPRHTILMRLNRGWPTDDALTILPDPTRRPRRSPRHV